MGEPPHYRFFCIDAKFILEHIMEDAIIAPLKRMAGQYALYE